MIEKIRRKLINISADMSRTILTRYVFAITAIILLGFVALGCVLYLFVADNLKTEHQNTLAANAGDIAAVAGDMATCEETGENEFLFTFDWRVQNYINRMAKNVSADVFITDTEGNVLMCSDMTDYSDENSMCVHMKHKFSKDFISQVNSQSKGYRVTADLDGIYKENYYIAGLPIKSKNTNSEQVVIGTIFAAAPADTINMFRLELTRVFLFAIMVTFSLSFILLYIMTYRMIYPLRQMAAAARSFGKGDFSVRVPVSGPDEIGQLAVAFNNMANSLSLSENVNRSFVANVSHELKTPMTTISGFIDGILDGTISREEEHKYLSVVSEETKRLSRIVRSMLDLSRIDSGEFTIKLDKFDLTETVFRCLLTFEQRIEDKSITVSGVENIESIIVEGDRDLIYQVAYNLFENAVKFTNDGGEITVKVQKTADSACVCVRNTGEGLSEEELSYIFDRFYKTDKSRSQDKTGVGLGLYLVKKIVSLHGGNIDVRSVQGEYSEFEFTLPLRS